MATPNAIMMGQACTAVLAMPGTAETARRATTRSTPSAARAQLGSLIGEAAVAP